jgi:hypothetical protein
VAANEWCARAVNPPAASVIVSTTNSFAFITILLHRHRLGPSPIEPDSRDNPPGAAECQWPGEEWPGDPRFVPFGVKYGLQRTWS